MHIFSVSIRASPTQVAERLFSESEKSKESWGVKKYPRGTREKLEDEDFNHLGDSAGNYQVLADHPRM
jgi:hypothetical protein